MIPGGRAAAGICISKRALSLLAPLLRTAGGAAREVGALCSAARDKCEGVGVKSCKEVPPTQPSQILTRAQLCQDLNFDEPSASSLQDTTADGEEAGRPTSDQKVGIPLSLSVQEAKHR